MAGLLAWAADVVGGESDPESPSPPAVASVAVGNLRFSQEQQEEIGKLDRRAGELQLGLQQLRQRLPPANAAQRLPHLHAESLALQSALALELHAHSATRIQAEIRESSLQADIVSYTKALEATEKQAADRASEEQELEKSLKELDQVEEKLKEECIDLENSLPAEAPAAAGTRYLEAVPDDDEMTEFQSLKTELAKWQTKVAEARKELALVENEALAWPSSVQREKDLELRFRTLAEQLAAKQAQAEKLIIERDTLELRVEHAMEARKNPLMEGLTHTAKRNKIGPKLAVSDAEQKKTRLVSTRGGLGLCSSSSSSHWRRSFAFRAFIIAYVFALHVVVLVVLSNSSS